MRKWAWILIPGFFLILGSASVFGDDEIYKGKVKTVITYTAKIDQGTESPKVFKSRQEFDPSGRVVRYSSTDSETVYTYNDQERKIIAELVKGKNVGEKTITETDEFKNPLKKVYYKPDGTVSKEYTFKNSYKKGRLVEVKEYENDKLFIKTIYDYGKDDEYHKTTNFEGNKKIKMIFFATYKKGSVVESGLIIENDKITAETKTSYEYQVFDDAGNWIRSLETTKNNFKGLADDKPEHKAVNEYREIEYY